jgi:hypothetical protein
MPYLVPQFNHCNFCETLWEYTKGVVNGGIKRTLKQLIKKWHKNKY